MEAGARGRNGEPMRAASPGGSTGSLRATATTSSSAPRGVLGSGFFRNAGTTKRVSMELALNDVRNQIHCHADHSFVDATFQSHLLVSSPDHRIPMPMAIFSSIPTTGFPKSPT